MKPASKCGTEGRLARYALAGSALLALPAAHAGTVYSGPVNFTATTGNSVSIDFNGDSATDLTLTATTGPYSGNEIDVSGVGFNMGPLAFGDPITLANTTSTGGALMKPSGGGYPWNGVTSGYLGVRFTQTGQDYLAWAHLDLAPDASSVTLNGYGYNDVAGASINAGDGAVPEPSSFALFALGAAGVLALRQRRKRSA